MNQILYMKDIEDNNIHPSQAINHQNIVEKKKSIKLISFLPVIALVPLLFVSMNIYASISQGNNTNNNTANNIVSVSENNQETDNAEETQENIPVIIDNNTENIENNTENNDTNTNNNSSSNSATYKTSDGKSYDVIATLNIPSLGIEYPVLSSTSTELLKVALNKYWGASPNQVGNMVIVGHNYKNTKFFSKLPNIQIGSIVKITDTSGITLDYKVYKTDVIDPYDNSCTSQLTNGHTEITLITCYNNGKQRFIAKARAN